jgi:hypothetical protein
MDNKISVGAVLLATAVCWTVGVLFAVFAYRHARFISVFWACIFFGAACALTPRALRAMKRPIDSDISDE